MLDDAELLPIEIDDYDTTEVREALEAGLDPTGLHPTGINKNRMRLPEFYDISMYYDRLKRSTKGKWLNPETGEYERIRRNKGEYGHWKPLSKEDLPKITSVKGIQWQINYCFPDELHNNMSPNGVEYGGKTVTYRRLYLILCERFNKKEYFVDTYFKEVYPYTMKEEVDVALQTVKDELRMYKYDVVLDGAKLTRKGELDRRYSKQNASYHDALRDYEKFKEQWEDDRGEELAELIAEDIKRSLANGQIRLHNVHKATTKEKRIRAGYDPDTVFYAMGDLIDHIQLYMSIRS